MRVLYVNHTAATSGAEHSLLVLLRSLAGAVTPVVACPEGELATAVRALGVSVAVIPGTALSARLHPLHTGREAIRLARAGFLLRALAGATGAEIVHANGARAGLMAALARCAGGVPTVMHIRDGIPPGRLPRAMFTLLAARTSAFIPTSRYLAEQLPPGCHVEVVSNAIEPDRFDPEAGDPRRARAALGLAPDGPVIAVVGQISPHKGQSDAIEILALLRKEHPEARLLLVGSVKFASAATRFDNRAYAAGLTALADRLGVADAVSFLGERADVAAVLAAVDVLLIPSWYEPFGRVALEGMIMRIPVVATSVGGVREVITDGRDGIVLAPRQVQAWASEVSGLLHDDARRASMGAYGRRRALESFSPDAHAADVVAVYEHVLEREARSSGSQPL